MIGKVIGSLLLIGLIILGISWFFSGESPGNFLRDITGSGGNGLSSANANNVLYAYHVNVGSPINKDYRFNVLIHVVKRTSDTLCYSYKVDDIQKGDPSFIYGYMKGYQGADEGVPVCVDLYDGSHNPKYHFTSEDTTITETKSSGDYTLNYRFENGVLKNMKLTYYTDINDSEVPVLLEVNYAGTGTSSSATTSPTGHQASTGGNKTLSSLNVSSLLYRFTWEVTRVDLVTNQTNGTMVIEYTVKVDITSHSDGQACLRYNIVNVSNGTWDQARTYMSQYFAGYNEDENVCTNIYKDSPQQIPYFLFNPGISESRSLTGNGYSGEVGIMHGILSSLHLRYNIEVTDEQGNVVSLAPVVLTVLLLNMNG